jgi:hypothetical protein
LIGSDRSVVMRDSDAMAACVSFPTVGTRGAGTDRPAVEVFVGHASAVRGLSGEVASSRMSV